MPLLHGWHLIAYYLTLPRTNLSGWEVTGIWSVLCRHCFSKNFRIQFETWGSFLTKRSASPCTSTNSLAPATISFVSCGVFLALCPAALQSPSFIHLLKVD